MLGQRCADPQDVLSPAAPRWHLIALIALILGVALIGNLVFEPSTAANGHAATRLHEAYLTVALVDACLIGYVARAGRTRWVLSELFGRAPRKEELAPDVLAATLGWLVIEGSDAIFHAMRAGRIEQPSSLLPDSPSTRVAWLVLAVFIAFSEEVVFRGYLLSELERWSRRGWVAILGQAGLFGLAHLDQGASVAVRVALYGIVLAVIARRRGSLFPAVLCHAAIDAWAGFAQG